LNLFIILKTLYLAIYLSILIIIYGALEFIHFNYILRFKLPNLNQNLLCVLNFFIFQKKLQHFLNFFWILSFMKSQWLIYFETFLLKNIILIDLWLILVKKWIINIFILFTHFLIYSLFKKLIEFLQLLKFM
jgi:hypothetical protein